MRARKSSDSPSDATRDVYPIRPVRPSDTDVQITDFGMRAIAEALRLVREQPHLETQDARGLFSRMVTPETSIGYDSALRRAAFGVLHLRALDRAEMADPFTGGDAA